MGLYIHNGDIVTAEGVLHRASIRSENGAITELGGALQPGDTLVEASGLLVYPGFIDLHVHVGDGADVTDATGGSSLDD